MAKLALNKSTLHRRREQLKLYRKVLPSLDLKRQQLNAELMRMRREEARLQADFERTLQHIGQRLPMLADPQMDFSQLVQVEAIEVGEENLLGVHLPRLGEVTCHVHEYSMLAKPHWVDALVIHLERMVKLQAQLEVAAERTRRTDRAVRRLTQRVNLFEKVLIPQAERDIQRIRIFLGDLERAAVVRSKIAKAKYRHLAEQRREYGLPPDPLATPEGFEAGGTL